MDICPQTALEIFGTEMSTDEICEILLKDKKFYDESDGGITLSGGECLLQSKACAEILKKTEIRIPYIPDYNDNQIGKIGEFLSKLKHVSAVRVLPYHNYAISKYTALGIKNTLPERIPTDANINTAKKILSSFGLICK